MDITNIENIKKYAKYHSKYHSKNNAMVGGNVAAHTNTYKNKINEYAIKLEKNGINIKQLQLVLLQGGDPLSVLHTKELHARDLIDDYVE
jgi:hypothetical protein